MAKNTNRRFFLAGIIQGSILTPDIHPQDYRERIRSVLRDAFPDVEVYCPIENHPESLTYRDDYAIKVFFEHVQMAGESEALIAFLPEASMGTAVEMWVAHEGAVPVVTISPMKENWTVRFLSDVILPDMDAFEEYVHSGALQRLIENRPESEG